AVMDQNLELAEFDLAGPFEHVAGPASTGQDTACREGYPPGATQGFALATLEVISSAARDERLAPRLHQRLEVLLGRYAEMARAAADVGTLLAALDQGAGLILLAGDVLPAPEVFTLGMRRLVDPARSAVE